MTATMSEAWKNCKFGTFFFSFFPMMRDRATGRREEKFKRTKCETFFVLFYWFYHFIFPLISFEKYNDAREIFHIWRKYEDSSMLHSRLYRCCEWPETAWIQFYAQLGWTFKEHSKRKSESLIDIERTDRILDVLRPRDKCRCCNKLSSFSTVANHHQRAILSL